MMTKSMVSVAIANKIRGSNSNLMRIGFGEFKYSDTSEWKGERYKGQWTNDKKNGKEWNDLFLFLGQGVYTWPNGDKYEGEFKDNQKEGKGVLTNELNQVIHNGLWHNNKPLSTTVHTGI